MYLVIVVIPVFLVIAEFPVTPAIQANQVIRDIVGNQGYQEYQEYQDIAGNQDIAEFQAIVALPAILDVVLLDIVVHQGTAVVLVIQVIRDILAIVELVEL